MSWYKEILDPRFIDTKVLIDLTVEGFPDNQSITQYLKDVEDSSRKKRRLLKSKKKWYRFWK